MSLKIIASDFEREYSRIPRKALQEIMARIYTLSPEDTAPFIRSVFRRHGLDTATQNLLIEYVTKGAALGIGAKTVADPVAFRKVWLNKVYDMEGVKLSARINDLSRHTELIDTLKGVMRGKESWGMAAQKVFDKGIQSADVAKDVESLLSQARKVYGIGEDTEAYAKYRAQVKAVQRRIDRLAAPDRSTLKRAYQNILDITNTSSKAAVESAARYAVYFKEKYNAERLTHTEISRAYGQARIVEAQNNEDVIGIRSVLNSGHSVYDICDYWAEADLYGMGPGVFPKNHLPDYPYHPFCRCALQDIYAGETDQATGADFDPAQGAKYLKSLPADKRGQLLGARGAAEFADDPRTWTRNLRNYHKPITQKARVPLEVLYGN